MIRPAALLALTASALLAAACHAQAGLHASEAGADGSASVQGSTAAPESSPEPSETAPAVSASTTPPSEAPPSETQDGAADAGSDPGVAAPLVADKDRIDPPPDGVSQLRVPGGIVFATGKSDIVSGPDTDAVLALVRQFLDEHPEVTKLRIEGHTDSKGKDSANDRLSQQRARAVADRLEAGGVAKERLLAVGFGSRRPIFANDSNRGRAVNRRIEFHIAELKGQPYMGADPTGGGLAE